MSMGSANGPPALASGMARVALLFGLISACGAPPVITAPPDAPAPPGPPDAALPDPPPPETMILPSSGRLLRVVETYYDWHADYAVDPADPAVRATIQAAA